MANTKIPFSACFKALQYSKRLTNIESETKIAQGLPKLIFPVLKEFKSIYAALWVLNYVQVYNLLNAGEILQSIAILSVFFCQMI